MSKMLSEYDYQSFTTEPDGLHVPAGFNVAALPSMMEPAEQPTCCTPTESDTELLVMVQDRRIRVLSPYWHVGWENAKQGAYVRSGIADRLSAVCDGLPHGFGLAVFDAWRPLSLQQEIYDAAYADPTLPQGFVSLPSTDPTVPPPHLTGAAVDVTLTWENTPLELGSPFDDFTENALADSYERTPGRVRGLRRLLYWSMRQQGFIVIQCEWWHFELGTRRWAALTGQPVQYGAAHLPE